MLNNHFIVDDLNVKHRRTRRSPAPAPAWLREEATGPRSAPPGHAAGEASVGEGVPYFHRLHLRPLGRARRLPRRRVRPLPGREARLSSTLACARNLEKISTILFYSNWSVLQGFCVHGLYV
jgi:hypothetical protein